MRNRSDVPIRIRKSSLMGKTGDKKSHDTAPLRTNREENERVVWRKRTTRWEKEHRWAMNVQLKARETRSGGRGGIMAVLNISSVGKDLLCSRRGGEWKDKDGENFQEGGREGQVGQPGNVWIYIRPISICSWLKPTGGQVRGSAHPPAAPPTTLFRPAVR